MSEKECQHGEEAWYCVVCQDEAIREVFRQRDCYKKALETIAELEDDCFQQHFKLTRFQAAQVARKALHETKN